MTSVFNTDLADPRYDPNTGVISSGKHEAAKGM
jgi:hypothetical protein